MKIICILFLLLVNSLVSAHFIQIKYDDIFCEPCLIALNKIFAIETNDIFTNNSPPVNWIKYHLQPEFLVRDFLKDLWRDAKTKMDKIRMLFSLNNYIRDKLIQEKFANSKKKIDLHTLISSITWCPGDVVAGPIKRLNNLKNKFDIEIYDGIDNKRYKIIMEAAIKAMKQSKFNDRLAFFKFWKSIININSKVDWIQKDKKWVVKKHL